MKVTCRCGIDYSYNIEKGITEHIVNSELKIPIKFCHECGGQFDKLNLQQILEDNFEHLPFNRVISIWYNNNGIEAVCLYRQGIHIFGKDLIYRSDFKIHLGMILEGEWYISKEYIKESLKTSNIKGNDHLICKVKGDYNV